MTKSIYYLIGNLKIKGNWFALKRIQFDVARCDESSMCLS